MAKVPVPRSQWKIDPAELAVAQERTEARLADLFSHRATVRHTGPRPPIIVDGVELIGAPDEPPLPALAADQLALAPDAGRGASEPPPDLVGVFRASPAPLVPVMDPLVPAVDLLVPAVDMRGSAPHTPELVAVMDLSVAPTRDLPEPVAVLRELAELAPVAPELAALPEPVATRELADLPGPVDPPELVGPEPLQLALNDAAEPAGIHQPGDLPQPAVTADLDADAAALTELPPAEAAADAAPAAGLAAADLVGVEPIHLPATPQDSPPQEAPAVPAKGRPAKAKAPAAKPKAPAAKPKAPAAKAKAPAAKAKAPATKPKAPAAKAARPAGPAVRPAAPRPAATTPPAKAAQPAGPAVRPKNLRPAATKTPPATVVLAAALCPYCARLLQPPPTASRHCPRCRQQIVVKRVEGHVAYLTEAAIAIFEAERRKEADAERFSRDRERWLKLAGAAGAPAGSIRRIAAAPASPEGIDAARALYTTAMDRAFQAAKRERRWEDAARVRRDQAAAIHRMAGSPKPPADDAMAVHREGVAAELRGLAEIVRDAELVSDDCCETCRIDDRRVVTISKELATPSLPHQGCPRGLCRCGWDLAARDREAVLRYLRRRARPAAHVDSARQAPKP